MAVPYGLGLTAVKYARHFRQMAALNVLNQQCSDEPSRPMATVAQMIQQRPEPIL
ncbi:hypothetical protein RvY_16889 [Ramazzottius varieornatus]|uniref:Uncharacterized protein n=1 Tax=Ramazzottius varieornatus TaxID=947166 RepID=A0A1D1W4B3_RAMVA|nr:hypothetical protein RvY_16889 [Ramazzottius varieornatus]